MRCFYVLLGDTLDIPLFLQPVTDQIRDCAHADAPFAREFLEVGATRHAAVCFQYLDDDCRRLQTGQSGEITSGLRMAGSRQHAAGLRHDRENMSRLAQVLGTSVGGNSRFDRARPIVRGDAGCYALSRFDRYGEVCRMALVRLGDHQRQSQLRTTLTRQREANESSAVRGHIVDVLRPHELGSHDQVTLVLAILVVDHDDHSAGANVGNNVFDCAERGIHSARVRGRVVRHSRALSGIQLTACRRLYQAYAQCSVRADRPRY